MPPKRSLSILIIHDNRAGHLNPSLGICEQLEGHFSVAIQEQICPNIKKWQISLLKKLSWHPKLFDKFTSLTYPPVKANIKADLIVCSGMPNLLYALSISIKNNIPLYYAGDTRKANNLLITRTITALKQDIATKQLILPTPPVRKMFTDLQLTTPNSNTALLTLGGPTTEHPFQQSDYIKLIHSFVAFCKKNNLTGLITNSRRTPNLESVWNELKDNVHIKLHLTQNENSKKLNELIQISRYIFVTEDSTSMLAEAIQSGRHVSSISTAASKFEPLNQKYIDNQLITRQFIGDNLSMPAQQNLALLNISQPLIESVKEDLGFN